MSTRKARPLMEDMRSYATEAVELLGTRSGTELAEDRIRFLAVARAVEIVGEAASQVPEATRALLPAVPFRNASAMRNRLIHGYGSVSADILANSIRDDFPKMLQVLSAALDAPLPDEIQ